MGSYAAYVGSRIKYFRKAKGFTIEKLAQKISKSKSAVSKYESGQISIDMETLSDISTALNVSIYHLVYYKEPKSRDITAESKLFDGESQLYVYYFDGRYKKLIKCLLQLVHDEIKDEIIVCYYLDVPSYESYLNSKYLYSGEIASYDSLTYFLLDNQANPLEKIQLCVHNVLGQKSFTIGMATGIAINSLSPLAMKVFVSKSIITDENLIIENLKLTKEDFKNIKDSNMLIVNNF